MIVNTKRLELVLLTADELKLWTEDIKLLEKRLDFKYKAEPLEGVFLDIVKGQTEITEKDSENYMWHSFWMIIRKEDRVAVGSLDFKDIPNEDGEVEIGYGLAREFEHNGYMTEACEAACSWALNEEGVSHITAETYTDGYASQNILKRCGFVLYKQSDTLWWKR